MKRLGVFFVFVAFGATALAASSGQSAQTSTSHLIEFLFTSDAHYGLTRAAFQGRINVDSHLVNAAMIGKMNALARVRLPEDGGVKAGGLVGPIDFVAEGGDIANREESTGGPGGNGGGSIQPAAVSWAQFRADYIDGLTLTDQAGEKSALFIVPGNHDVTNAVGFYKKMTPLIDKAAMVEIYNG
jgi:3',5'-cyclic AMP phosphodiesterase CpdA